MPDPSFIESYTGKMLIEKGIQYKRIKDIRELLTDNDIDKIKSNSTIVKSFVISCIITIFMLIGFFLCFVIPCVVPVGLEAILISSISIVSLFLILSLGAGIIFFNLHKRNNIFLDKPNSPFINRILYQTSIESHFVNKDLYKQYSCFLDVSTLSEDGSGLCLSYFAPQIHVEDKEFLVISILCIFALPFVTLFSILYNSLRFICAPIYVLGCFLKQQIMIGKKTSDNKFRLVDCFLEAYSSLRRIVKAPFYAIAMFFSLVYSFVSVKNSRIITGLVEQKWNEDVALSSSFHICFPHKHWRWEGGGKPGYLGKNGYYIAGCMQPRYVFFFKNWKFISGKKLFNVTIHGVPLEESFILSKRY